MTNAFNITPPKDYTISNIAFCDEYVSGVLNGNLLDDGRYRTQADWIAWLTTLNTGKPAAEHVTLLTGLEFGGLIKTLYTHRNDKELGPRVEKIRQILSNDFSKHWMVTGSRIFIPAEGLDHVIHGLDREQPVTLEGNISGTDGYIADHSAEGVRMLLGMTPEEANEIYGQWINNKKAYECLSSKPTSGVKARALLLSSGILSAYIGADIDGGGIGAARGWIQKSSTGNEDQ